MSLYELRFSGDLSDKAQGLGAREPESGRYRKTRTGAGLTAMPEEREIP